MNALQVAIIGAGRAGCAIFHGWVQAGGTPPLLWTRSVATAEAAQRDGLPAQTSKDLPNLTTYDLVLLAVSDGSVEPVAQALAASARVSPATVVAHLSGALDLSPLGPLMQLGIEFGSLHPALSIAHRKASLRSASAAVDGSSLKAEALLADVATKLGMRVIRPKGDRARYHAAASIAGNFPQVLLEAAMQLLIESGLSREDARRTAGGLLLTAANNAVERGPSAGLTGPIVRGDVEVVAKHLRAIAAHPNAEKIEPLYRSAGAMALDLAREVNAPRQDALETLLRGGE